MSLNETPRSTRVHIGLFGKRNTGKSSLINAITNQDISLVSDVAGTTTDPVYKSMEISGIGPCVIIDTAGFDDVGKLGEMRIEQTKKAMKKTDIAVLIFTEKSTEVEKEWYKMLREENTPVVIVINKSDLIDCEEIKEDIIKKYKKAPIIVSAKTSDGIEKLRNELINSLPEEIEDITITNNLVKENDTVLLVMPQDIQAPKGRLILPQVQTLRDLLDKKCIVMSCTTDKLELSLKALKNSPNLIITDSQVFKYVYEKKPQESKITSFSTLFAKYKGDIEYFVQGVKAFEKIDENSKILIAEACTHVPLSEDIGREKIPNMLRKRYGKKIEITNVNGVNFPKDLSGYDLIIHCGACMFNRKYVLNRVKSAKEQNIPMSNYGVVIAYLSGILDKVDY